MDSRAAQTHLVLVGLLLVSAVLFAFGITIERFREGQHSEGVTTSATRERAGAGHSEAQEQQERRAGSGGSSLGNLGTNTESTTAVVGVVVISVVLAAAVWLRPTAVPIVLVVVVFCVITGVFDTREAFIQLGRTDHLLVVLATLIAVFHLGGAVLAIIMVRRRTASLARVSQQA